MAAVHDDANHDHPRRHSDGSHEPHHPAHEHTDESVERVSRRPLAIALAITAIFLVAEIVGGILTNSLALLADAGHMATDVGALSLALFAVWIARWPPVPGRSFGYLRAEVLAALLNAAALVIIALFILWEAFKRLGDPPQVQSALMLAVAVAGLLANAASAWVLMRGGGHEENLNTRGALLHVIFDLLGSAGAILAALIMLTTGWFLADPILSAAIAILVLWSAWRLLSEAITVLLEATPKHIDEPQVRAAMAEVDGVDNVHDLHVWTVTSGLVSLSSHVEVSGERGRHELLLDLAALLRERFGIAHVTLQLEEPHEHGDFRGCTLDTPEGRSACLLATVNARQSAQPHPHHIHH